LPRQVTVTSAGESWAIHFGDVNSGLLKTVKEHPQQPGHRVYEIVEEGEGDGRKSVLKLTLVQVKSAK
jgi:hypothetical protein